MARVLIIIDGGVAVGCYSDFDAVCDDEPTVVTVVDHDNPSIEEGAEENVTSWVWDKLLAAARKDHADRADDA